jgi:hypothetical protein
VYNFLSYGAQYKSIIEAGMLLQYANFSLLLLLLLLLKVTRNFTVVGMGKNFMRVYYTNFLVTVKHGALQKPQGKEVFYRYTLKLGVEMGQPSIS